MMTYTDDSGEVWYVYRFTDVADSDDNGCYHSIFMHREKISQEQVNRWMDERAELIKTETDKYKKLYAEHASEWENTPLFKRLHRNYLAELKKIPDEVEWLVTKGFVKPKWTDLIL